MRLISVFCIGLLIASFVAPRTAASQSSTDEAYQALQTGDYAKARSLYESFLRNRDSLNTMNVVYFAETYLVKGEYEEGLAEVEELTNDDSSQPYILYVKGQFLEKMGHYEEAQRLYFASAELKNDLWRNILALGELLQKTGQNSDAQQVFSYIFRPYKNNSFRTAEDLGVAARAAAAIGEYRDANNAFRTAYQLDPTHIRNLHWWAELFRVKYNDAEAQQTLDEALAINPEYGPLYNTYARSINGFAQKEHFVRKGFRNKRKRCRSLRDISRPPYFRWFVRSG